MIEIKDKNNCTGCNACEDICSRKAISFIKDYEGFEYPVVDNLKCNNCGLCQKICPVLSTIDKTDAFTEPQVYAAIANDFETRLDSTSGGLFSTLASIIYENNGYVGGCILNDSYAAEQYISNNPKDLELLRSSKYLQSTSHGIYSKIKKLLKEDNYVLYCGTPCQISALHNYLNKTYDKLLTIDFLCHGVNTPLFFSKYIKQLENEYDSKVKKIKFKAKKYGWHNFSMRIVFDNETEYCRDRNNDAYFVGYLKNGCFARPSCYNCKFRDFPHKSDITLADFWGVEKLDPDMDDDKGISLVFINSHKGEMFFDKIKSEISYKKYSLKQVLEANPLICKNISSTSKNRQKVFEDLTKLSFPDFVEKYIFPVHRMSLYIRIANRVKRYLPYKLRPSYWRINNDKFHELYEYDKKFNAGFGNTKTLTKNQEQATNIKILKIYRKCQASIGTFWFSYYYRKLVEIDKVYGVGLHDNLNIGKGLIIGHTGRIVINARAKFSENLFITHGVTIGRDIRGKRKGVPTFGKNVSIRCNSTVVGGITIGDDVLIAPNTFVNFDVPSHSVVIGNPATIHHKDNATDGHIGKIID